MPTNRRRSMRRMTVSGEAAVWLATEDAKEFFGNPGAYLARKVNPYATPVQSLPGIRPWWDPLADVLIGMREGEHAEPRNVTAVEFLKTLEAAWNETR